MPYPPRTPLRAFEVGRRPLEAMPWFQEAPVPGRSFRFVPVLGPNDLPLLTDVVMRFVLQTAYKGSWITLEGRTYLFSDIPSYPDSWMVDLSRREARAAQPKNLILS